MSASNRPSSRGEEKSDPSNGVDGLDDVVDKFDKWTGIEEGSQNGSDDSLDMPNILEIYGFDATLKTGDITTSLIQSGSKDFSIKWINDTHALAVFSNATNANTALKLVYPGLRLRPLNEGIDESKFIAKRWANDLLPHKPRPQTSVAAAHRLVTSSLGIRSSASLEQRRAERKKIQDAKDKRRQAKQQADDVWEGNVD